MINRVVRGFTAFYLNDYEEFGLVKDFCYTKNILEKVVADVVINKSEFLKGAEPLVEESVFEHPNIPDIFKTIVAINKPDKSVNQCE